MAKSKKDKLRESTEEAAQRTLSASTSVVLPPISPDAIKQAKTPEDKRHLKSLEEYNQLVLNAYKEKYGKKPEKDKNGNNVLNFDTPEEATAFFKELADQKTPFFAMEVDANGNPTGHYMMSYGNGDFKEGKVDPTEISALHQQFIDKMTKPEPKPEARHDSATKQKTTDFRSQVAKKKESSAQSDDSLDSSHSSTLPNPLDTGIPKLRRD